MKNLKSKIFVILLLLLSFAATAQFDDPEEDPDAVDAPVDPVPIDDYMVPMLLFSVAAAYFWLRKDQAALSGK